MPVKTGFKEFRKAKNLTRKVLGEQLSVSDRTIENWEKGRTAPDTDALFLLTKHYPNLNLNWLITGKGSMWLDQIDDEQVAGYLKTISELKSKVIELYGRLEEK